VTDISLCANKDCPLNANCKRAQPSTAQYQSWTRFEPYYDVDGNAQCDHFLALDKPKDKKK